MGALWRWFQQNFICLHLSVEGAVDGSAWKCMKCGMVHHLSDGGFLVKPKSERGNEF
jgi:hypothetical protein